MTDFVSLQYPDSLTFDDVLMLPDYSDVLPSEVSTKSYLTPELCVHSPVMSAAMDTVTEHKMAQAMARQGGLGVIHKNMSIKSQCYEVEKVKKYESGMIRDPITLTPEDSVQTALDLMQTHSISGVPVVGQGRILEGILTHRDLRFETKKDQPVHRIMTPRDRLVTAQAHTTLDQAKQVLHRHRIEKLPVVDLKGRLIGLITIKDIEKAKTSPHATKDRHGRLFVGAAVGVGPGDRQRALALKEAEADLLCVDTAHGHSKNVLEMLAFLRKQFPGGMLMAGNVATGRGALALSEAGADMVKVGMGPGSICTTRVISGVGAAQVSAIVSCVQALQSRKTTVVADGGIRHSGDVAKALALGASSVMVGGLLAGSEESPGEVVLYRGRTYKVYQGMGSLGAMRKGSKDRYRQEGTSSVEKMVPEGVEGRVPYRGAVQAILYQMMGGLRSAMGYVGVKNLSQLQKKARFVRLSSQGLMESHIHGVSITREAPNYRVE